MRSNHHAAPRGRTFATLAALLIGLCLTGLPAVAKTQEDSEDRRRELEARIRDAAEEADWDEYGRLWGELGQQIGESVAASVAGVDWEAMASDWAEMGEVWAEIGARIGESFADADWDGWATQWEEFGEHLESSFDSDDWREFEREMERLGESLDGEVGATVEAALESIDWDSIGDLIGTSIENALQGLEDIEITFDDDGNRKPRE